MLSLTRKTDCALVALAYLGQCRSQGDPAVSAREIAELFHLPPAQLMNILKELARAKLVVSTRGAGGGYRLAQDPRHIALLEVVTAVEGPVRLAQCCTSDLPIFGQENCESLGGCPIQGPIHRLHDRINQFLGTVTLADLLETKVDVPWERVGR